MPRRIDPNRDLQKNWKISLPATVAGKVEYMLFDRITNQPKYGARNKLISGLLLHWIATTEGRTDVPPIPQLEEVMR